MWGYGKTSVINLIVRYLESLPSGKPPIIVKFNPWMIGGAARLVQEFLIQLASEIGIADGTETAKKAAKHLLTYSRLFSVLKLIPGAEFFSLLEKATEDLGAAVKSTAELLEVNIDKQRGIVTKALADLNQPIVVFIDDIDRLPPDEVFQMVRLVKAISDFPRISFVLAFDPSYLQQALKECGISDAEGYLEKIVQLRIHLPPLCSQDIDRITESELNRLTDLVPKAHFSGDEDRFRELYFLHCKPLIRTVRDVKRIVNRLRLSKPATRGEVCFSDLFALELIAIRAPKVYELLRAHPGAFVGGSQPFEGSQAYVRVHTGERETAIQSVPLKDQRHLRALIEELFPLTSASSALGAADVADLRRDGRVAATDRLIIALSFGLPSDEVPTEDARAFIGSPGARDRLIELYVADNRFGRFVELIRGLIGSVNPPDYLAFLLKLGEIADDQTLGDLRSDAFGVSVSRSLGWVARDLLDILPDNMRAKVLVDFFGSAGIALSAFLLGYCIGQHGEDTPGSRSHRWCDKQAVEQLKALWLEKIKTAFENGSIFNANENVMAVHLLIRTEPGLAKQLIDPLLINNVGMDRSVRLFGINGRDSVKGAYAHVSSDVLDVLGGVSQWKARAQERLDATEEVDTALSAIYRSILTGRKYYLVDASEAE
jgi:hypothetical protein